MENMIIDGTTCESCDASGHHGIMAVGYSKNPDWEGYALCQECMEHFDSVDSLGLDNDN